MRSAIFLATSTRNGTTTSGCLSTMRCITSRLSRNNTPSLLATISAERLESSNRDISPNISPAPSVASTSSRPLIILRTRTMPSSTMYTAPPGSPSFTKVSNLVNFCTSMHWANRPRWRSVMFLKISTCCRVPTGTPGISGSMGPLMVPGLRSPPAFSKCRPSSGKSAARAQLSVCSVNTQLSRATRASRTHWERSGKSIGP